MAVETESVWDGGEDSPGREQEEHPPQAEERRRSTTSVLMTTNVTLPKNEEEGNGLRRTESMRGRLSKQNATVDEPSSIGDKSELSGSSTSEEKAFEASATNLGVPCIEEHNEEEADENEVAGANSTIRSKLVRAGAVCGDDDTKLRPQILSRSSYSSLSKSLSRESSGADYTDRCGVDLHAFIVETLHKSKEDRDNLLDIEARLIALIDNPKCQSETFEYKSTYLRMVLHRVAAYFGLDHNVRNVEVQIVVNKSDKTCKPTVAFRELIMHNNFKTRNRGGLHHVGSFGGQLNRQVTPNCGSTNSLEGVHLQRAQSLDINRQMGSPSAYDDGYRQYQMPQQQPVQVLQRMPPRQSSLQLQQPMQYTQGGTYHAPQPHQQWARGPQRSFDGYSMHQQQNVVYGPVDQLRRAGSYAGMVPSNQLDPYRRGQYYPAQPVATHTPPVMAHYSSQDSVYHQVPYEVSGMQNMRISNGHDNYVQQEYYQPQPQAMYPVQQTMQQPILIDVNSVQQICSAPSSVQGPYYNAPLVVYQQPQQHPAPVPVQYYMPAQNHPAPMQTYVYAQTQVHGGAYGGEVEEMVHTQMNYRNECVPCAPNGGYSQQDNLSTRDQFIQKSVDGGYCSMNQESSRESDGGAESTSGNSTVLVSEKSVEDQN